ncbi:hypothetical protein MCUN1_001373 [Malassezia cuniculi]|uniref:Uncharacterized protein n=1 Tax=Malassezia cuniculi TaxID=948313 RepID=A0AAF0ETZ0_9BASI|nr:hypothetical protein MCUN1_001373 [Malassezia cuniculi]
MRGPRTRVVTVSNNQNTEARGTTDYSRYDMPDLPKNIPDLRHLVVVAGHAIWNGRDASAASSDSEWILEPYQRNSVKTFVKHIAKGLEIANADPSALLVFSGGRTRPQTLQSEAESYYRLALGLTQHIPRFNTTSQESQTHDAFQPFDGSPAPPQPPSSSGTNVDLLRMTTEDYARDSFENLLFSIARFREFSGRYPERITVVGYGYKKERFVQLHARAVRWPRSRLLADNSAPFTYVGIDDENLNGDLNKHEHEIKYRQFEADMYGCHGKLLNIRRRRNPARRVPPYAASAPEIADLIKWCPLPNIQLQGLFPGWLPWDPRVRDSGLGEGARSLLAANGGRFVLNSVLPDGKRIVY